MSRAPTEKLVDVLQRHTAIVGAYLFGSRAHGEEQAGSDIDLAVYGEQPLGLDELVALETELEQAVELPVDVVDLRRAGTFLALDAIRGERIFGRDGRRLDELDLEILRRAGDLAPFERERRRLLLATHQT